jgi:hypothetical protein
MAHHAHRALSHAKQLISHRSANAAFCRCRSKDIEGHGHSYGRRHFNIGILDCIAWSGYRSAMHFLYLLLLFVGIKVVGGLFPIALVAHLSMQGQNPLHTVLRDAVLTRIRLPGLDATVPDNLRNVSALDEDGPELNISKLRSICLSSCGI